MILGLCGLAGSGKDTVANFLAADLRFVGIAFADPLKQICKMVYRFTDEQLWGPSHMRNQPDERWPRPAHDYVIDAGLATCACCGYVRAHNTSEPEVQCYLTARFALQLIGSEWGRRCYPHTWAVMGVQTAKDLLGPLGHNLGYDRTRGLYTLNEAHERDLRSREKAPGVVITDVRFRNEIQVIREAGGRVLRVRRPGAGLSGGAGTHPSEAEQAAIPDEDFDGVIENDSTLDALRARSHDVSVQLGATG